MSVKHKNLDLYLDLLYTIGGRYGDAQEKTLINLCPIVFSEYKLATSNVIELKTYTNVRFVCLKNIIIKQ